MPDEYAKLNDVIYVKLAESKALVALRKNGTLAIWGFIDGMKPIPYLSDVVSVAAITDAVAVIHSDGTISCFGNHYISNIWNKVNPLLTDVRAIYECGDHGFIAITGENKAIYWGKYNYRVFEDHNDAVLYKAILAP